MDEPVYLRPADYRYCLRSVPHYWWFTGAIRGDRQLLLVGGSALVFDRDGRLLSATDAGSAYPIPRSLFPPDLRGRGCPDEQAGWVRELGFEECPVLVRRFWLPERWLEKKRGRSSFRRWANGVGRRKEDAARFDVGLTVSGYACGPNPALQPTAGAAWFSKALWSAGPRCG